MVFVSTPVNVSRAGLIFFLLQFLFKFQFFPSRHVSIFFHFFSFPWLAPVLDEFPIVEGGLVKTAKKLGWVGKGETEPYNGMKRPWLNCARSVRSPGATNALEKHNVSLSVQDVFFRFVFYLNLY